MTNKADDFSWKVLDIDLEAEAKRITERLRDVTSRVLNRRGLVVAISGGIDSSCSIALAVRAIGPERVFALILPERDSSDDSAVRGKLLAEHLGVQYHVHDIAPALEAIGCYQWRDEAISRALPGYGPGWRMKIVISGGIEGRVNTFHVVAEAPDGRKFDERLNLRDYLQIVAATNFKQRLRKTLEYFHADRLNYAVVGTPNRLEYDQGFFVKNGDGSADVKPIAHLYKSQVYAMAKHLGLPERITSAVPTTDTYSLPQGQDEFYFALPYREMDLALWALNHQVPAAQLAKVLGCTEERAAYIYRDIETKRRTTRYLHRSPVLMESVKEITPNVE
ncbi:NH(3)-dependent NAD(+) synthetase [Steroidobacter agaridevorans]|uniref:NH(3)-dependent NAD(+) synthetase n=1 Tax=Steroidobacter agaridevorans TaxID=2695856 RepID=A0A829YFR4_9GAMM|nr:NAD(+) synthase [Steroidobacter agaridevorans]GFE82177.1 NH(3)-dependent NAD(+) synthetase [Steroidobacter agaridevorans]GFE85435.1 NH(3)-dependent NAD(+) synthetase [Steroidobacter agaridevorans]